MAGTKNVYVVSNMGRVLGVYSTQGMADAAVEAVAGAFVEMHEFKQMSKKGAKRSTPSGENAAAPAKKAKTTKQVKEDAKPLEGIEDVFLGKKFCFVGTMKLKHELMEQTAANHGSAASTKKMTEADVVVTGARLSDGQHQEIADNAIHTITEDDFKDWLVSGQEPDEL